MQAAEMVIKMSMEGTDKQSGQTGSMVIAADTWIAPQIPGYAEVREFHRRMAEKLNWTPGGGMFASRPDVQRGMSEVEKESAKLDGMPVFQTTVMGGEGTAPVDRSDQPQGAPQQQQSDKPSATGALGNALGSRLGLGRKKQTDQQPASQQSSQTNDSGVLLEMTTELKDFSAGAVDSSQFEVPAGFKKISSDSRHGAQ